MYELFFTLSDLRHTIPMSLVSCSIMNLRVTLEKPKVALFVSMALLNHHSYIIHHNCWKPSLITGIALVPQVSFEVRFRAKKKNIYKLSLGSTEYAGMHYSRKYFPRSSLSPFGRIAYDHQGTAYSAYRYASCTIYVSEQLGLVVCHKRIVSFALRHQCSGWLRRSRYFECATAARVRCLSS